MNISQMMRSLLGDVQSGDSKKLELKPGQVVRGVVMQLQGDQEAVVQINGVQVRAKLEAKVAPGQLTMMKVQPESTPEQIVLKPVEAGNAQAPDDTVRQLAKAAGLPDADWALDLVKQLKRDGMPMSREVAQALKQAFESMPKGADPQEWMQAAAAALKRGMPMTEQTVAAMRQVMFGKPLHELIDTLNKQLGELTVGKETPTSGAIADGDGRASSLKQPESVLTAALRVKTLLTQTVGLSLKAAEDALRAASNQAPDALSGGDAADALETALPKQAGGAVLTKGTAANAAALLNHAAAQSEEALDGLPAARGNTASGGAANASAGAAGTGAGGGTDGSESSARTAASSATTSQTSGEAELPGWIGRMLATLGVSHENKLLQAARAAGGQSAGQAALEADSPVSSDAAQSTGRIAVSAEGSTAGKAAETLRQSAAAPDIRTSGAPTSAAASGNAVQAGMTAAEDGQHAAAARSVSQTAAGTLPNMAMPADGRANAAGMPMFGGVNEVEGAETLKSALMSLAAMDDMPASVRETAQQLINQVTGQQLMLAPERSGSMLTHVTLFIPLYDEDGAQTASVHVQTRRGAKNELDASNCRLLFDLKLKAIGDTLVDVHVVDNIVNLHVWNDHPAMQLLAEEERGAVAEALQLSGYQLLTFKVKPLPAAVSEEKSSISAGKSGESVELPPIVPPYGGIPYKGVDYRI